MRETESERKRERERESERVHIKPNEPEIIKIINLDSSYFKSIGSAYPNLEAYSILSKLFKIHYEILNSRSVVEIRIKGLICIL